MKTTAEIISDLGLNSGIIVNTVKSIHILLCLVNITELYMIALLFERPLTAAALHNKVRRNRTTKTHTISGLKSKGYIEQKGDMLYLTDKGLIVYHRLVTEITRGV